MKKALVAAILAVFLWNVYRAAFAPITTEEAITYNRFVSQPILNIIAAPYHPANQIFHSLLTHLILRALRLTEFAFRISSLLGLALYFLAILQVMGWNTRSKLFLVLTLILNPLTLRWLPPSTGIWMGTGIFLFGIQSLLAGRLKWVGVWFAAAAGFNIALIVPSLAAIFLYLHVQYWHRDRVSLLRAMNYLFLPLGLSIFCIWGLALMNAAPGSIGYSSLMIRPLPRYLASSNSGLPLIARQLRDQLRRQAPHRTNVAVSDSLRDAMEFYRRRYALGAIELVSAPAPASYSVLSGRDGRILLNHADLP